MKINEFFINIPPYLSLSWKEVAVVFMQGNDLLIKLKSGEVLTLPQLNPEQLEAIFSCHARFLEMEILRTSSILGRMMGGFPFDMLEMLDGPLGFKIGTIDGIITAVGHNPAQAKSPTLPTELLNKIASITKQVGIIGRGQKLPSPEAECNCFFCQIMCRLNQENELEEPITEEDLKFSDWTVQQTGDKLFSVEKADEKFSVYLGHPVGCSCGKEGCDHLIAVLKS